MLITFKAASRAFPVLRSNTATLLPETSVHRGNSPVLYTCLNAFSALLFITFQVTLRGFPNVQVCDWSQNFLCSLLFCLCEDSWQLYFVHAFSCFVRLSVSFRIPLSGPANICISCSYPRIPMFPTASIQVSSHFISLSNLCHHSIRHLLKINTKVKLSYQDRLKCPTYWPNPSLCLP